MNANQIINMIVRTVMRKVIRSGVNAGMDAVGSRMKRGKTAKGHGTDSVDAPKRMD
ncbi:MULTISPECIES: hypothetical protein [unclassified Roseovarius]|uniref:hypothetical protein n=1 Tax=unclassified Roseovarius TaxID=2614913 RepID=UPI00273DABB2|nr:MULTISPECIES: hypothetical protein [unclassified Roseovarius]